MQEDQVFNHITIILYTQIRVNNSLKSLLKFFLVNTNQTDQFGLNNNYNYAVWVTSAVSGFNNYNSDGD